MTANSNFKDERKNTDKSLDAERNKSNKSIVEAKEKAEQKTDQAIKEGSRLDIAITQEREIKSTIESKILKQERAQTDQHLAVERTKTDSVVEKKSYQLINEVEEHSKTKVTLTTRDEFLAIVSHDLRNPIGAVSSCMDLLLDEAHEFKFDPDTKGWLELAKRNADAALRLIKDILEMERLAEGKLELKPALYELGSIISESIDGLNHVAIAKNIHLHFAPSAKEGMVKCDRDRVLQILSNLIGNALKFTPDHGEVVVKTEWAKENVKVLISDSGPGIPIEKQSQIFDKFAQLGSKDRTGLGLGLYISKSLVEAHGGNLNLDSKLDEGSTFSFQLPLDA